MTLMRKLFAIISLSMLPFAVAAETVTLDRCVELARGNYPAVRKYGLAKTSETLSLADINRGWLPRVGVYAQGTAQNAVPAFPDALSDVLDRFGQSIEGLSRLQWKAGIDISQTIWDGGVSRARRKEERALAWREQAVVDVELYHVGQRVADLYFGILLMREQISQNALTIGLLESNHRKLLSMAANGAATKSDADMVEARILTLRQMQAEADGALGNYVSLLEIYTGEKLAGCDFVRPALEIPSDMTTARPELRMYDAILAANDARRGSVAAAVMPRIGLFAQGYYGYPGFDYFKSMTGRDPSLNLLAGIKVTWNIDAFYTKRNNERRISIADESVETERLTFLFNNRLESAAESDRIRCLRDIIRDDARIINIRADIRRVAESQLANGVIDTDGLLARITEESQARLSAAYHEIQLLQYINKLKQTLNR